MVSGSAVASAGLASALAALITSRFGVAGTLIGAALTTMIITGGAAVLKSYLEGVTGRIRKVPGKVRQRAGRRQSPQAAEPQNIPSRPDLRNNFIGRLRAAFDWFLRLPPLRRRAIMVGAIVPAIIAFLISMGAVTGLELAIGKSLPCGIWNNCPVAADGSPITSTRPTLVGGGSRSADTQNPVQDFQQAPGQQNVDPGVDPGVEPVEPQQPVTPEPGTPGAGEQPVDPATPAPAPADQAPAQGTPVPSE